MGCTIDHLSADHRVRVIQAFTDARGVSHRVGEEGLLRQIEADFATREISLVWERDGQRETMVFLLSSRTGPGNGRMKQFFELGDYVDPGRPGKKFIPNYGYVPATPPELPPVTDEVIRSFAQYAAAIQRVWALAGRKRFAEAEEQLMALLRAPDQRGDVCYAAAESICDLAMAHGFDADPAVYDWLRERGTSLWYSWGAQATSGGEGECRATEIRAAEEKFERINRARSLNA